MNFTTRSLLGAISAEEAIQMIHNYDADNNNVSRSVWFDIEQIQQLAALLKAESLVGANTDGIRVYFARYGATVPGDVPPEYAGQNTVVFVSTKAVAVDNEIQHFDYFEGLQMTPPKPKPSGERAEGDPETAAENRGELCRPSCKGTFDGQTA